MGNKKLLFWGIILLGTINSFAQTPCSSGFQGNGVDDYITIPNTDAINLQNTRNRTIEFWFNTSDITTRQVLYEEGAQVNTLYIYLEGGRIYLGGYRDNASSAANRRLFRSGDGDIQVNTWYHVALTLEDTTSPDLTFKWFLNGIEQDSQDGLQINTHSGDVSFARNGGELRFPSSLVSNWTASSVGGSTSETYSNTFTGSDGNDYNYAGNIALFRIWNVARTQAEIDANKSAFLTSGTDLVAYLDQDQIIYQPDGGTSVSASAQISGTEQFTVIPNTDAINLQNTRNRTVELRFNPTDITTRQVLYEEGGGVNAITAWIEDGRVYLGAYRNSAGVAADRRFFRSASGTITTDTWYHIAITLEDTASPDLTLKWFLDGVEQDSQDGLQVNTHSGDVNVGRGDGAIRFPDNLVSGWTASSVGGSTSETYDDSASSDGNTNNFTGSIDLFRIWNVARTQSEIDTNQNTLLTSGTSLVAYQEGTQINYQPNGGSSITEVVNANGVFTWDGSSSNVWATTTNWTGDNAPDATRRQTVTIADGTNDPILTTEVSVGKLIVNSGVEIVIQNNATLHIYYQLENNGTITVEDGGALIYHSCEAPISGSGTFNVNRNSPSYTGEKFFSYWSSPIIETDADPTAIFPTSPIIYSFNSSIPDATWAFNGTTNLKPAVGYAVRSETSGSFSATFTGKVNEGTIAVETFFNTNEESTDPGNVWSTEGDNLIGNPYPSAINWDLVIQDPDNSHLEGTIYFWDQNTAEVGDNNVADYRQYNLTGGASNTATGFIGSGQGFFVRSLSSGTVRFKPTHQVAANNNQFFRNGNQEKKEGRSWFSLRKEEKFSSMLVGFVKGASRSYDRLYDAPFDVNNTTLGLFSLVEGDKRTSIQGLPPLKKKKKVVKLGYVVDEVGEYTIQLDEEHIDDEYYIYLRDRQTKTSIDMRSTSYTFQADSIGENLTRFRLIYTKKKRKKAQTSREEIVDEELLDITDLTTYVNRDKHLIVELNSIDDEIEKVTMFNIRGSRVASFLHSQTKNVAALRRGIYILAVELESGRTMTKKIAIVD